MLKGPIVLKANTTVVLPFNTIWSPFLLNRKIKENMCQSLHNPQTANYLVCEKKLLALEIVPVSKSAIIIVFSFLNFGCLFRVCFLEGPLFQLGILNLHAIGNKPGNLFYEHFVF